MNDAERTSFHLTTQAGPRGFALGVSLALACSAPLVVGCGSAVGGAGGAGGSATSATSTSTSTAATGSTGSGSDQALCQKMIKAFCMKLFQCVPAGTPKVKTEADCEAQYGMSCTAGAACPLDASKIDTCVADVGMIACTGTSPTLPTSCDANNLCQMGGQPYCLGQSVDVSGGGVGGAGSGSQCTLTLDSCSDGNTYSVACGTTCTCTVNGQSPKGVPTADYCGSGGRKAAIAACGWNLYSN